MNAMFFDNLKRQFRAKTSPTERYSEGPHFRVYDRSGANHSDVSNVCLGGFRKDFNGLWVPHTFCEVYVYGGPTDQTVSLELTNVYQVCQPTIEKLMQALAGSVDATGRHWIARGVAPLTHWGANEIRLCATGIRQMRAMQRKFRHRMLSLSHAFDNLANAIVATVIPGSISLAEVPGGLRQQ